MSIRFITRTEIDSRKWDDCILRSPYGQVFFMSWYLDSCCPGWSAMINGDYESVFPLAGNKKWGLSYLYQPYFTRHFGMIGKGDFNPEEGQNFLDSIPEKFKYIDFCVHGLYQSVSGYSASIKTYQTLNLNDPDISAGYSENLHRLLRKARQAGLQLVDGIAPEDIVASFQLHQTRVRDQFSKIDYERLINLMHAAKLNTAIQSICALDNKGNPLAGAFFIGFKQTLLYLKGYSTESGRKAGAMHFLFSEIIQSNYNRYSVLDFGGSSIETVARFYRHFGSTDSLYLRIRSNRLPKAVRWLKKEQS